MPKRGGECADRFPFTKGFSGHIKHRGGKSIRVRLIPGPCIPYTPNWLPGSGGFKPHVSPINMAINGGTCGVNRSFSDLNPSAFETSGAKEHFGHELTGLGNIAGSPKSCKYGSTQYPPESPQNCVYGMMILQVSFSSVKVCRRFFASLFCHVLSMDSPTFWSKLQRRLPGLSSTRLLCLLTENQYQSIDRLFQTRRVQAGMKRTQTGLGFAVQEAMDGGHGWHGRY